MKLNSFRGGIHPAEHKALTEDKSFEQMPPPATAMLPLSQHLGKPARLLLKKGDYVCQGALAGESDGFISANVHIPINGQVQKPLRGGTLSGFPGDLIAIKAGDPPEPERARNLFLQTRYDCLHMIWRMRPKSRLSRV